jgi:hypothetical protein
MSKSVSIFRIEHTTFHSISEPVTEQMPSYSQEYNKFRSEWINPPLQFSVLPQFLRVFGKESGIVTDNYDRMNRLALISLPGQGVKRINVFSKGLENWG